MVQATAAKKRRNRKMTARKASAIPIRGTNRLTALVQLKVDGPGIRQGRIPVPDLIRICQEMQNAVSRQAEAIEGKKNIHPGPISSAIRSECTLELIGIGKGSALLRFDLAKPQVPLFDDQGSLAVEVLTELASTIKSLGNGGRKDISPGVLNSLYSLGSVTEGKRISKLSWILPGRGGHKRVSAEINKSVRARIATQLSKPRLTVVTVDGVLDEADFLPTPRHCRIDPALGHPLNCTFSPDLDNVILGLMRRPVRITGEGHIPPYGDRPDSVQIQMIHEVPSLDLGRNMFFANYSIEELAATQNIKPLKSASDLATSSPEDEDVDAILEEIYSSRK